MRLDPSRLEALRQLLILDSGPERAYEDITRLLATTLAVPFTMVNFLDAERDWFKACSGVQQTTSPTVTSFCEAFFHTDESLIVAEDTLVDERFMANPKVVGRPFIRFYAAARLVVSGQTVGTLCAYDVQPRRLSAEQLEHLRSMTGAVVELLARRQAVGGAGAAGAAQRSSLK